MIRLSRRLTLFLPLFLLACGADTGTPTYFEPLRYAYLPPIQLNVAAMDIQQRFIPSGFPPDVTANDPAPPTEALVRMAADRLQALGASGRAVFAILNASLIRRDDSVQGDMLVSLAIYDENGTPRGSAEAHVERTRTGPGAGRRQALYEMTRDMMDDMNVEFEYQVRRNLRDWLATSAAPETPIRQDPLNQPQPELLAPPSE